VLNKEVLVAVTSPIAPSTVGTGGHD
jgi:hypothetical protein